MNRILTACCIVIILVGVNCGDKKNNAVSNTVKFKTVEERIIDVKKLENLTLIHNEMKFGSFPNSLAFDEEGTMYFLDSNHHRLLKISSDGKYLGDFGGKGDKPENLENPGGVFIKDGTIYVLDYFGRKIKLFCTDGTFRYEISLKNAQETRSIFVDENYIYLNTFYKPNKNFTQRKVVTVLSKEGHTVAEIGTPIPAKNPMTHMVFNRAFIQAVDGQVIIAYQMVPLILAYDLSGNETMHIDLKKKQMQDIQLCLGEAKGKGLDSNNSSNNNRIRVMYYCDGFSGDGNGMFYYTCRNSIYKFDKKFQLMERITGPKKIPRVSFSLIMNDSKGNIWGFVHYSGQFHRIIISST